MLARSAFSAISLKRVVALPSSIDAIASAHTERLQVRTAPDEILIDLGGASLGPVDDPHAIVATDDSFRVAVVRSVDDLAGRLEWDWPPSSPLGQGLLHNVAVKLVRHRHLVLLMCPSAFVHELEERLA